MLTFYDIHTLIAVLSFNSGFMLMIFAFNPNENLWIRAHLKLVEFELLKIYSQRMSRHTVSVSDHRVGCWPYQAGEISENPEDEYISPGWAASVAFHHYHWELVRGGLYLIVQKDAYFQRTHPPQTNGQIHLTSYSIFLLGFRLIAQWLWK